MRLVNIDGASAVSHPVHGAAEAGTDGVFDLPEPFGQALLTAAPTQWRTEFDHVAALARKRLEELADPQKAAELLNWVHGRVTDLESQVADLTARLAELEKPAEPPADPKTTGKTTK